MKRTVLTITATLAFGLCALAQQKPANDPRSAPPGGDPNAVPAQQAPEAAPAQQNTGERKLKGCLRSQGGSLVLEEKKGKQVTLSGGQDLAAHVGHTVIVHGTFASAASAGAAGAGTPAGTGASAGGDQFTVSRVEMVSETCSAEKGSKDKDKSQQPQ